MPPAPESRSHIVSFRLTPEEHDRFRELCLAHGLPSITEMVRAAINMMFAERSTHALPRISPCQTRSRVHFLTAQLQKLTQKPPSRRMSAT